MGFKGHHKFMVIALATKRTCLQKLLHHVHYMFILVEFASCTSPM